MNELKIPTNLETFTLNEQINNKLIEISKIKEYFGSEIKYQELLTKKLSKYITCFDYTNIILTVFFLMFLVVQIYLHMLKQTKNRLLGLITFIFSLVSCLNSSIVKILLYETQKKKKRHGKLFYLSKNKLDCIEMLLVNQ